MVEQSEYREDEGGHEIRFSYDWAGLFYICCLFSISSSGQEDTNPAPLLDQVSPVKHITADQLFRNSMPGPSLGCDEIEEKKDFRQVLATLNAADRSFETEFNNQEQTEAKGFLIS